MITPPLSVAAAIVPIANLNRGAVEQAATVVLPAAAALMVHCGTVVLNAGIARRIVYRSPTRATLSWKRTRKHGRFTLARESSASATASVS
ncbi:MAG: hypothetical protein IPK78_21195 [Rhodospirillales bacterium]|nr:hypothetical protein [Rhodospirillales bacterium]